MPQHPFTADFEDTLLDLLAEEEEALPRPVLLTCVHAIPYAGQITVQRVPGDFVAPSGSLLDMRRYVTDEALALAWRH